MDYVEMSSCIFSDCIISKGALGPRKVFTDIMFVYKGNREIRVLRKFEQVND